MGKWSGLVMGWLLSVPAWGVLGQRSNIPRLPQLEQTDIYVFKDHRARTRFVGSSLIQTKEGEVPKLKVFSFDRSEMKLNSFKAWTVLNGQKMPVPENMIQINPVYEESGFSNHVNVEVAFPRMNVGAVVQWEYEVEELTPPLQGFFSFVYRLDSDFHLGSGFRFHIDSEVPLYTIENDPNKVFEVSKKKHTYDVRLKQDVTNYITGEPYSYLALDRFPTAIVSTSNRWDKVGTELLKQYQQRLTEPATPLINTLVRKVRGKKKPEEQFRELTRLMGKSLRYMGDWRSRFASQVPRTLKVISDSQFGDCKDFSLVAVRVLRQMGYKANLATVYSDRIPVPDKYYVLPVNYFNHQIVHVKHGKKDYWIDPTSAEDPAFIDDNLSQRMAIVWENKPVPRRIPGHKDTDNGFQYKLTLTPKGPQFGVDLKLEFWGLESKFAKGESGSENSLLHWVNAFFPDGKAIRQELHAVAPTKDRPWAVAQSGRGAFESILDRTPMGEGFRLNSSGLLKVLLEANPQWRADFDFGFPSTREYQVEFKERNFIVSGDEKCEIRSPWVNISLVMRNSGNNGLLTYKENFKVTEISNKDIKGKSFRQLQEQVRACLIGRFLLVQDPKRALAQKPAKKKEPSKTSVGANVERTRKPEADSSPARATASLATSASSGMTIALKKTGRVVPTAKVHSRTMKELKPLPKRHVAETPASALAKSLKADEKKKAQKKSDKPHQK